MRSVFKFTIVTAIVTILVSSCALEKRHYTKGFHHTVRTGTAASKKESKDLVKEKSEHNSKEKVVEGTEKKPLGRATVLAIIACVLNIVFFVIVIAGLANWTLLLLFIGSIGIAVGAAGAALSEHKKNPDKYRGKKLLAVILFISLITPIIALIKAIESI